MICVRTSVQAAQRWLQEPDLGSDRNVLLGDIRWQHDHHATRSVLAFGQPKGSNIGLKYVSFWGTQFNLVLRSYRKIQTFRNGRENYATPSGYIEYVLDLK